MYVLLIAVLVLVVFSGVGMRAGYYGTGSAYPWYGYGTGGIGLIVLVLLVLLVLGRL